MVERNCVGFLVFVLLLSAKPDVFSFQQNLLNNVATVNLTVISSNFFTVKVAFFSNMFCAAESVFYASVCVELRVAGRKVLMIGVVGWWEWQRVNSTAEKRWSQIKSDICVALLDSWAHMSERKWDTFKKQTTNTCILSSSNIVQWRLCLVSHQPHSSSTVLSTGIIPLVTIKRSHSVCLYNLQYMCPCAHWNQPMLMSFQHY